MHTSLIPADKRRAIGDAIQAVFSTREIDEIAPVRAGLSGALVCRVVVRGTPVLLRVQMASDALRDPLRQYACMTTAAEAGVAPPLRYADAESGVAITDFIETRPLSEYPGGGPGLAIAVGCMLATLRQAPVFPPLVDYFDGMEAVTGTVLASGVLDEVAAREPFAAYREIRDAYPRLAPEQWVSSHNDPNPSNVLYDGQRLWLVDWESAFAADPFIDPAMLANWFGVNGEGEDQLLEAVFGEMDDIGRARFGLMRQVCNMFVACMMLNLVAAARRPGDPPITDLRSPGTEAVRLGLRTGDVRIGETAGQLAVAKALLGAVLQSARSPDFTAAARLLAA